jgi:hypothetical protein
MRNKLIVLFALITGMLYASGEITLQGYLKATKGTRSISRTPGSLAINWTGSRYFGPVIYSATPTWKPVTDGSIGSNGIVWVQNVGNVSTNAALSSTVILSFDSGTTEHLYVKTN